MKLPSHIACQGSELKSWSVFRLESNETLTLSVRKPGWENFGVNILAYKDLGASQPITLRVTAENLPGLTPGKAVRCLTAPVVDYIVRHSGDGASGEAGPRCMLRNGQQITNPRRIFYSMHDDLPPDDYKIKIESKTDSPVYLRFFTLESSIG